MNLGPGPVRANSTPDVCEYYMEQDQGCTPEGPSPVVPSCE
eukprot:gene1747-11917_t